ncbi:MAG: DUF11 domain-containing protein, partial [Planctomycetia bacterium]|nr:DUF11 domain-containing protein [Planctomycetia bacterium]
MSLFDTLFPPQTRRPVRRAGPLSRGRRSLRHAEALERRQLLTIARNTTDQFFVDPAPAFAIDSQYAEYIVSNTAAIADAWVKVDMLTPTPSVSFGPGFNNEDGLYRIGAITAGSTKQAFIYFSTPVTTNTAIVNPYRVTLYSGKPGSGTESAVEHADFSFTNVQLTQRNAVNKISTISFSSTDPVVGGSLTMTVTGRIGNTADRVLFTPASRKDWKPDVYRLESVGIAVTGGPPVTPNLLFFDPAPTGNPGKPFTADYTFRIDGFNTDTTQVQPTQFTQQNQQQWEHHDTPDFAFPPIPPVKPTINLAIAKTDGEDCYVPGTNVLYTVTVTNLGTSDDAVSGVVVTDPLPANTTFVSGSAGVTLDGTTVRYTTGTIPKGGNVSFTFTIATPSDRTGDLVNVATATPPANVNLTVTKTDGSATYTPGVNVTYTIVVTNTGPSTVTGALVSDPLPANTSFISATGGAVYDSGSNSVKFTTGTLIPTGSTSFTFTILPDASRTGPLVNTVFATPPEGTGGSTTSATDTDTASPVANLTVTKTDGSATYTPGVNVTYTIVVTNTGPSTV